MLSHPLLSVCLQVNRQSSEPKGGKDAAKQHNKAKYNCKHPANKIQAPAKMGSTAALLAH